jgi:hypothetical protein
MSEGPDGQELQQVLQAQGIIAAKQGMDVGDKQA